MDAIVAVVFGALVISYILSSTGLFIMCIWLFGDKESQVMSNIGKVLSGKPCCYACSFAIDVVCPGCGRKNMEGDYYFDRTTGLSIDIEKYRKDVIDSTRSKLRGRIVLDREPCSHNCLSHISHPCEVCGRTAGRGEVWFNDDAVPIVKMLDSTLEKFKLLFNEASIQFEESVVDGWTKLTITDNRIIRHSMYFDKQGSFNDYYANCTPDEMDSNG